jgi:hypothetical protein
MVPQDDRTRYLPHFCERSPTTPTRHRSPIRPTTHQSLGRSLLVSFAGAEHPEPVRIPSITPLTNPHPNTRTNGPTINATSKLTYTVTPPCVSASAPARNVSTCMISRADHDAHQDRRGTLGTRSSYTPTNPNCEASPSRSVDTESSSCRSSHFPYSYISFRIKTK